MAASNRSRLLSKAGQVGGVSAAHMASSALAELKVLATALSMAVESLWKPCIPKGYEATKETRLRPSVGRLLSHKKSSAPRSVLCASLRGSGAPKKRGKKEKSTAIAAISYRFGGGFVGLPLRPSLRSCFQFPRRVG